ncbi:hypothetical protein LSH36_12g26027 [Paralvinella palmiformis]|uniref:Uncharacterized protein n=1 Tax=Paralvinella palmiformis TaxID=53620 RepID=A0AAD9KD86_9ANNE|nr:hypothetical protein LSH36_12g26027 [Paralvinella palmiformis]
MGLFIREVHCCFADPSELLLGVDEMRMKFEIQVLPEGSYVKKEFSPDRVKIVIDGDGRVLFAPAIG